MMLILKYIYNKPWSTENELIKTIEYVCCRIKDKSIWINVAPVNKFQEQESPGANENIKNFNNTLSKVLKKHDNCGELDIFNILKNKKDFEIYCHKGDSHLNVDGNKLYSEELLKLFFSEFKIK